MPVYTGDYLRDTQHLSCSEHGIFLKLLMYCWDQKGPAPIDERRLCGIVNARSGDEIEAMRRVLAEFFIRMEDGYYNKRMQTEIERASSISLARSAAGHKGYEARAKQLPSKCLASASTPTPTLTLTLTPKEKSSSTKGSRFTLTQLPDDWALFASKERPDLDPQALFAKFSDYWTAVPGAKGRKVDWGATWRNFVRSERAVPAWAKPPQSPEQKAAELMRLAEERGH